MKFSKVYVKKSDYRFKLGALCIILIFTGRKLKKNKNNVDETLIRLKLHKL